MQRCHKIFNLKPILQNLSYAFSALALSSLAATCAYAQEADASAKVERVEITGSNIARVDAETPSPVQIITADDLKKSGFGTIAEVLQNLTANGQGTLSQSFSGSFAAGASGVSLRGLTVAATLVLIDGHRMAPYPLSDDNQRSFVDTSNIPFDTVERIEILKDGASAVYGSDAIAGVVNIILKKTYKGTSVNAEAGTTQQGGGTTNYASVIHGFGDLSEDGYNAYFNLEYRHEDPILLSQRAGQPWTNTNWTAQGGNNLTLGSVDPLNGGAPVLRTPYLFNANGDGSVTNPANFAFYPGCNFNALNANQCTFSNTWSQLQPRTQNINLIGNLTKKLADGWQLNVKASVYDSQAQQVGTPPYINSTSFAGNTAFGPGMLPNQVGIIPNFTVPATYPGNPFNNPAYVIAPILDLGAQTDDINSKTYRLVADLTGTLGAWDIAASVGFTKVVVTQTFHNDVNFTALYNALNNPTNPYLLTGGNSAAANAAIAPVFSSDATDELDFVEAHATHDLAQLPGGALSIATGLGFIHRNLDDEAPAPIANGTVTGNNAYAIGQQNDGSAYAEISAPLLQTFELEGAARWDHYDTYGNSLTPKAGFKFTPIKSFALRGTYSKGFRAPGPAENQTAGIGAQAPYTNDPLLCPDGKTTTKGNATQYCSFQPFFVQEATPTLQPEKSTSETLGLILEPIQGWQSTIDYYSIDIRNQIVSAASLIGFVPTYVRGAPQPTTISNGNGGTYIGTPAYGPILYDSVQYVNADATKTTGVEFETVYKFKLGEYGSLRADLQWTHVLSYDYVINGQTYELAGTHGPSYVSGDTGNPKDRIQSIFSYDKGAFDASTSFNWIGSYNVLDPSNGYYTDCQTSIHSSNNIFPGVTVPSQYCSVRSFLSTDLTLTYVMNANLTVHGTVLNLFNQAPPIDLQTYGGSGGTSYNPSMHEIGAEGRTFKIGAIYKF